MGRIIVRLPTEQTQNTHLPPQELQYKRPEGRYIQPRWLDWTLTAYREDPFFPPRYRNQIPYLPTYARTTLQPINSGIPAPSDSYKLRLRMAP